MTVDPGTALITLHGAVLAAAVTGHYKYNDRSDHFEKSLKGVSDTLSALKRQIASGLAERLRPVFENSQSVTTVLLDASGKQFQENFVNPVGSEAYRDAVFSFASSDSEGIVSLRALLDTRDRWLFWARIQSWDFLVALVIEGVLTAGLFVIQKVLGKQVDETVAIWTLAPVAGCFAVFVIATVRLSVLHDVFVELRKKYASP